MFKVFFPSSPKERDSLNLILSLFVYYNVTSTVIWRRQWHPTPVLLPGKSHGQRSLVGCSQWGRWVGHDWATSLWLFTLCIGEGNGNPLQYSCLENPRDGGAWWAAIYGVAQSQTRLKRLSSSNSSTVICLINYSFAHSCSWRRYC